MEPSATALDFTDATIGMLLTNSAHWCEQNIGQERRTGILTGKSFFETVDGGVECWPEVHWENTPSAHICNPINLQPFRMSVDLPTMICRPLKPRAYGEKTVSAELPDRSHEECAECVKEMLDPPRCKGHAAGPVGCPEFIHKGENEPLLFLLQESRHLLVHLLEDWNESGHDFDEVEGLVSKLDTSLVKADALKEGFFVDWDGDIRRVENPGDGYHCQVVLREGYLGVDVLAADGLVDFEAVYHRSLDGILALGLQFPFRQDQIWEDPNDRPFKVITLISDEEGGAPVKAVLRMGVDGQGKRIVRKVDATRGWRLRDIPPSLEAAKSNQGGR